MNDPGHPPDPIAPTALRILAALAASESPLAAADWSAGLAAELLDALPRAADWSGGLVGPNTTGPGLRWHAEQLGILCAEAARSLSAVDLARRRYHARMLGHGLAPEHAVFQPLVTILLPVYNRAGLLVEAVQSCMAQTWRPLEILVVDDGSTDDVGAALARFGPAVRLVRKSNGGDASARNLGLREAMGDFIHFLDSDDLLMPNAVEDAVAAYRDVADADLCYGQAQRIDMRVDPPRLKPFRVRELHDPIRSMIVEFAFPVPAVMMPRWRMLAMPPFEEDLTRSSDWRYWQGLGFARARVIGLRTQSALLRRFEASLQAAPHLHDDSHALAALRGLRDLLHHPHAWVHATEYLNVLVGKRLQPRLAGTPSRRIGSALSEVASALGQGHAEGEDGALSLLPVIAAMRGRIARLADEGAWLGEAGSAYRVLERAVAQAAEGAAHLTERDIAFWTRQPLVPMAYRGLRKFFGAIARHCPPRDAPALAEALLRRMPKVPGSRAVRRAARLQPVIGSRLAGAISASSLRWAGR